MIVLALNPEIRVETHWGEKGTNAVAVLRGPLLYTLQLDQKAPRCGETRLDACC